MAEIIYGSELSKEIKTDLKQQIDLLYKEGKRIPCLAVIMVGNNPASLSYVKGKEKACTEVGMISKMFHLEDTTTQEELNQLIRDCSQDKDIDGILIQLPLPAHLNEDQAIDCIDPSKDVDGLHPMNFGRFFMNREAFIPCTPRGVMELLKRMHCDLDGKMAVVVGRSKLVGTPVARLLQNENATVTVCHSHTKNLKEITKQADILIAAIGKAKMFDSTYIKDGAYVIDVGINRTEDGHLVGDCDFDDMVEHAKAITPVPKGVGPMTITMLLENTLESYRKRETE